MRILFNTIAKLLSQGLASFADNFSLRSNTTGGLGTSTSGADWQPVNGTIEVVSGAAKATTTPTYSSNGSAYPMSTVKMSKSDVNIKLSGTNQGSTAAIWVQDADEWWGIVSRAVQTSTPGNTTYGYQYAVVGNSNAYNASTTTNYGFASSSHSNYQFNASSHSNYGWNASSHSNFGWNASSHSNFGWNASSHSNYGWNASSHTNYATGYTRLAFFVYGFSASTNYSIANYTTYFGASYGTKYNSKYASAYNRYSWSAAQPNYTSSTSYGYKVNATYYVYNTNSDPTGTTTNYGFRVVGTTTNYGFGITGTTTNYGFGVTGTTTNYGFGVTGTTTNYGFGVAGTTTNYFYNSSSFTSYALYTFPNYGFQYGVTGTNATTYTVNQYLEIIRSTASAVTTISSALVSTVATIKSILVSLSGNQITAKAYSDPGFVTQIGSDLVYNPSGIVLEPQFGIAISPSEYDQSDIIGTSVEIDVV